MIKENWLKLSMKYQYYNYTLNPLIQKWKIIYQQLNGFTEKQMHNNRCLLNNVRNIQFQGCKSFKFIHPEKLCPTGIWKISFINKCYFAIFKILRNVAGSSSVWEYHLPMQPYENNHSYSNSNEIYQKLTQHTVGDTPKVNHTRTILMKIVVNFIDLFSGKTFLYVKTGFASTFAATWWPFLS